MALTSLSRLGRNLLYGFRRELRPYETAIFQSVLGASSEEDKEALLLQFDARERVQRWTERILYFGLPRVHALPRVVATAPDYCYAKVKLSSPLGKVTAKLMTHRGVLSTIEFSRDPTQVLLGEFRVESVALHPGGTGYAEEINEAEHGPRTDA